MDKWVAEAHAKVDRSYFRGPFPIVSSVHISSLTFVACEHIK